MTTVGGLASLASVGAHACVSRLARVVTLRAPRAWPAVDARGPPQPSRVPSRVPTIAPPLMNWRLNQPGMVPSAMRS